MTPYKMCILIVKTIGYNGSVNILCSGVKKLLWWL